MRNDKYFPETSSAYEESKKIGLKPYKDLHGIENFIHFLNETFQNEYLNYIKNEEYFPGCPFRIYKKHYQRRLDEYFLKYPGADQEEYYFLEEEDQVIWALIQLDYDNKNNFYKFYRHLKERPHWVNLNLPLEKTRDFIDDRIRELGHGFQVAGLNYHDHDPFDIPNLPRQYWEPRINPNAEGPKDIKLIEPDLPLPENSSIEFYHIENEQGVYFIDDDLLYIDKKCTYFVYDLVSRIIMQKKEIAPDQEEKLKELDLVAENAFPTYLYKRFIQAKEIPKCDILNGSTLLIDLYEENIQQLQEWVRQIQFIYNALSEDPAKRIILMQKVEDLIKWQLVIQTSKAYQDEFNRVLNYFQESIVKPEVKILKVPHSGLDKGKGLKLSAKETAYLAYYFVEAGEYKLTDNIGTLKDWVYFSEIASGANSDNIRKDFKKIEHNKDLRLRASRLSTINNTLTYIKCNFPDKIKVIEKAQKELEQVQN
jgi:hypothetical protein